MARERRKIENNVCILLIVTAIDETNSIDRLVKLWLFGRSRRWTSIFESIRPKPMKLRSQSESKRQFYCDLRLCSYFKLNKYPLFSIFFLLAILKNLFASPSFTSISHDFTGKCNNWLHFLCSLSDNFFTKSSFVCLPPQTWCVFLYHCKWK
jgi:hypothetical protein